jgi:hypothetical protein
LDVSLRGFHNTTLAHRCRGRRPSYYAILGVRAPLRQGRGGDSHDRMDHKKSSEQRKVSLRLPSRCVRSLCELSLAQAFGPITTTLDWTGARPGHSLLASAPTLPAELRMELGHAEQGPTGHSLLEPTPTLPADIRMELGHAGKGSTRPFTSGARGNLAGGCRMEMGHAGRARPGHSLLDPRRPCRRMPGSNWDVTDPSPPGCARRCASAAAWPTAAVSCRRERRRARPCTGRAASLGEGR